MNKVLVIATLSAAMLSIAVSVIAHIESASVNINDRNTQNGDVLELAANDWASALEALPQYKKPVIARNNARANANNKPNPAPKPKPAPRQPTINDAVLIGVVDGDIKQAILLQKKRGSSPMYLTEGESWLKDWKIEKIEIDRLVWVNPSTSKKQVQLLFGKS